jgi:soluble lytic murein transglycosylase-like protein/TolA-binding protein
MLRMLSSVLTCLLLLLWCRVACAYATPEVVYSQRLQQALTLTQQGAWVQALETIGELERPRLAAPALGRLWFLRGTLAQKLHDTVTALEAFTQVWHTYPPLADYAGWEMARLYAEHDRLAELQRTVGELGKHYPLSLLLFDSQVLLARTQQRFGLLAEARATLEHALQTTTTPPTRPTALAMLAQIYENSGELALAAQTWQRLGESHPQDARAAEALQRSRQLLAQVPEARALQSDPIRLLASIDALATAKLWEEVDARLQTLAGFTQPDTLVAAVLLKRGGVAVKRRQWMAAETNLYDLLLRYPQGAHLTEAHALLARTAQQQNDTPRSLQHQQQVLLHGPDTPWAAEALFALARAATERGDLPQAHAYYRQLGQVFPTYEPAQEHVWEVGWTQYQQRDYAAAERVWQDFTQYFPQAGLLPQVFYWQGRIAQLQSNQELAVRLYQHVVTDYPTHYYCVQAREALRAIGIAVTPILAAAPTVVAPATPQLLRLSMMSANGQPTTPERFHVIRAQELQQLQMPQQAVEEIQALTTSLPNTPAVHYFLAGLLADNQRYLDVFRLLNRTLAVLSPAEIRSLPREFWLLLYPRPFWEEVVQQANNTGLDPYLVLSIMRQESAFNPAAVSRAGARGLLQLMPATAREVATRLGLTKPTQEQLHEPQLNIVLGTDYFTTALRRFGGNMVLALAGYNAGPGRASRWRQQWPGLPMDELIEQIPIQETRLYVKLILRNLMLYELLYKAVIRGQ